MYLLRRLAARAHTAGSAGWERRGIPSEGAALVPVREATGGAEPVEVEILPGRDARAVAHVVPFVENERASAALVVAARTAPSALFVDGGAPLRVSVLGERSEIVLAGERLYFTAREPLVVTRFDGDPVDCALCGDAVGPGAQAIVCSGCGATSHEGENADGEERLCFTHHGRCPRCHLSRSDFAWTPEADAR